ncbi:hypothetical protein DV702_14365 [Sporosarcina sp. PTS2304]|nr:hypothetical protein DV702_14365 [Sporosarcina sp. PTS2304]
MQIMSVRFRILPAEPDAFLRGRGGLARSALAITPVKCKDVLLLAALDGPPRPFRKAYRLEVQAARLLKSASLYPTAVVKLTFK